MIYDNGQVGGVWEVKPVSPSLSAALATPEALAYSAALNTAHATSRFAPGSSQGAPQAIPVGGLILQDRISQKIFMFTMPNPNDGAIYWEELEKQKNPVPNPVNVPVAVPEKKPEATNTPYRIPIDSKTVKRITWTGVGLTILRAIFIILELKPL